MHGFFCVCSFFLGTSCRDILLGPYLVFDNRCFFHSLLWSVICATSVIGRKCGAGLVLKSALLLDRLVYPETKGIPLEEMDAVFGEGEL